MACASVVHSALARVAAVFLLVKNKMIGGHVVPAMFLLVKKIECAILIGGHSVPAVFLLVKTNGWDFLIGTKSVTDRFRHSGS